MSSQMIFWNSASTFGDAKDGMGSPVLEEVVVAAADGAPSPRAMMDVR